jgi:glycerophosphoryl diester phosphodiesterase
MAAPDWLTARPIAHRGFHDADAGRIENTMAAVVAAIEHDFAIELDLAVTTDDRVVAFHDDTLDRLTESTGRVDAMDLAALKAARFRGTRDRIPTLEDILDQVDGRVPLVLELKSSWGSDRRLERSVAAALSTYSGPVAVMSFDPGAMRAMRGLAPALPRGLIADRFDSEHAAAMPLPARFGLRHLLAAPFVGPSFVAYSIAALPASAPLALRHFFGLPLLTWTVRTEAHRRTAGEWADQIIFEGFDPDTDKLSAPS